MKSIGEYAFSGCLDLTSLIIPNSVISIDALAFYGCSGLTSITFPNSVTSIGEGAFDHCSGLSSIIIPNSITSIGLATFQCCTSLSSVTIPNSVTSIGNNAFYGCSGLTSVVSQIKKPFTFGRGAFDNISDRCILTVPKGKTNVYIAAGWTTSVFQGGIVEEAQSPNIVFADAKVKAICVANWDIDGDGELSEYEAETVTSLGALFSENKEITSFDELQYFTGLTSINDHGFWGCENLTSITIPNSVTSIGRYAFLYCYSLASIAIPNSVTSISDGMFYSSGLTSIIIPNSVTSIGSDAFTGCGLTSIIIPNSVTSIGSYAFWRSSGLTSITIPNSVTSVGYRAFYGCSGLTSLTIESGLTETYGLAFEDCVAIKEIIIKQALPFSISEDFFDEANYQSATLYVPTGRKVFFQEHYIWGKFASIEELDMPDVEIDPSPFNNLYSKRLILSYTESNSGGSVYGTTRFDYVVQAVNFPAERMTHIKGNKITHIRFCLGKHYEHVSDLYVFIGSSIDDWDLFYGPITDLHEGWNEIALNNRSYTITGDSIFVGVYYLKGEEDGLLPIMWDEEAGQEEGACLLYDRGSWKDYKGRTWLIECMVEGDNIPKYDLHIKELVEPLYKRVIKAGETYDISLKVRNWGSMPIIHYEMQTQLDGKDVECTLNYDSWWSYQIIDRGGGLKELHLQVTPDKDTPVGRHRLSLIPKSLNGEEYKSLEAPVENTLKVYEHDMGRQKILVQVYTGTWCGYCPEFDQLVEEKRQERGDLAVVDIHSRTRYYITTASESYLSMMYRDGFPNVDLNRCVRKELNNIRDYTMTDKVDDAKTQPAFANVNIAGSYDENSHVLSLTVSGERNEDFLPVEEWTNLTVLLVEDDIIGEQWGADDPSNYHHPAVLRTNISDIWGDRVEWNGDKYEMHYTTSLDDLTNIGGSYNIDNMRVVAFLGKPFTGNNYEEIGVVNCNEITLNELITGIQDVNVGHTPSRVYDMNGRMVRPNAETLEGLPHGIYIVGGKKIVK